MPKRNAQANQTRLRIAREAARLIAEHGIGDYFLAKRKAAANLGVDDRGALPRNTEIEAALRESARLFNGNDHADRLTTLRRCALALMEELVPFDPRLVGGLVSGALAVNTPIEIHVFSDPAELVAMRLIEQLRPYSVAENRLRVTREYYEIYPAYVFEVDDVSVELTVFAKDNVRQAPLSPVDGRPMKRISAAALRELIAQPPDSLFGR